MNEISTIRERIARAASEFSQLDALVFTTFSLDAGFLEDNALPIALGIDAETPAARRAALHPRLYETPCSVFYDPTARPKLTGKFKYVARPVPVKGRFFHPKLVVMVGRVSGNDCVYLVVSSANLTMSGWGRNAESFGETWIHAKSHPSCEPLLGFLEWLATGRVKLGEEPDDSDAVQRACEALRRLPPRRPAVAGEDARGATSSPRFYVSTEATKGLVDFLRQNYQRRPSSLMVYSPYWSDVATQLGKFDAQEVELYPALRERDAKTTGLTRDQAELLAPRTIRRNPKDGERFWHLKAYRIRFGKTTYTAVGSCNFTSAGLSGGDGNVEAMLVFEDEGEWLPTGPPLDSALLAEEGEAEDEAPEPCPVAIVVAWDWRDRCYRWWIDPTKNQRDFEIRSKGLAIRGAPEVGQQSGPPPERSEGFQVTWLGPRGRESWEGPIVELNLYYSERVYGRSLSTAEILDAWRGDVAGWGLGGGGGAGNGDGDQDGVAVTGAIEAMNLYDLFRSIRVRKRDLEALADEPAKRVTLLVSRPDSVMALVRLVSEAPLLPTIRYVVLRELSLLLRRWDDVVTSALLGPLEARCAEARSNALADIRRVVPDRVRSEKMLVWFETELSACDEVHP